MLQPDEQNYLDKLPPEEAERIIHIQPYTPYIQTLADNVISRLRAKIPGARIEFMGASALGISGQNDIDIYVLASEAEQEKYHTILTDLLGEQIKHKWHWMEEGYEISVYLADPTSPTQKRQIEMHTLLKNNPELLKEYEQLKAAVDGQTYKVYQTAKYEFYNRVL